MSSKLWIVHRSPPLRAALGRAAGLTAAEVASGAPVLADFAAAGDPAAVILGLAGDQELELGFAQAARARWPGVRWIVVCGAGGTGEVQRLFGTDDVAVIESPPSPQRLRAEIRTALERRTSASLAERRMRARIGERFAAWFGAAVVPGLALALDPPLARWPLLVRGRPGSGRALLGRHVLLANGDSGAVLRVDARELADAAELVTRLQRAHERTRTGVGTLWLDDIDQLPASAQLALADWIRDEAPPAPLSPTGDHGPLRWVATAGLAGLDDQLAPPLARAFVPRTVSVPPLEREIGEIARLAVHAARRWASEVGGPARVFGDSALAALAAEPWWGERAELEAVLRATLATARGARIEALDLRFPDAPVEAARNDVARSLPHRPGPPPHDRGEPISTTAGFTDLSLDADADPSSELTALTERWAAEDDAAIDGDLELGSPRSATAQPVSAATSHPPLTPASNSPQEPPHESSPDPSWRRLARSLAHEIRNPLVSIRTFTELLPEHYADETFRARFKGLVGKDVAHIQDVVSRLSKAADRDHFAAEPVDVSVLIERLLAARRERIGKSRLVVLSELEPASPWALADADALETALSGLIDRALDSLPERGDLFIATRRVERAGDGRPRLRVLLRHHDPRASGMGGELDPVSHILEYVLAETIVTALGGRLTIDPTQGPETLIVIDLPTP